jgi:hypothetical protein
MYSYPQKKMDTPKNGYSTCMTYPPAALTYKNITYINVSIKRKYFLISLLTILSFPNLPSDTHGSAKA